LSTQSHDVNPRPGPIGLRDGSPATERRREGVLGGLLRTLALSEGKYEGAEHGVVLRPKEVLEVPHVASILYRGAGPAPGLRPDEENPQSRPLSRSAASAKSGAAAAMRPKSSLALGVSPPRSYRSAKAYQRRRWWGLGRLTL